MSTLPVLALALALLASASTHGLRLSPDAYLAMRNKAIAVEESRGVGGDLQLSDIERTASNVLLRAKEIELNKTIVPTDIEFVSGNISSITNSTLFALLRKMPKGAVLHLHSDSMVDVDWVIQNVTILDTTYICFDSADGMMKMQIAQDPQKLPDFGAGCKWTSIPLARKNSGNPALFDAELKTNMTMITPDPVAAYPNSTYVWAKFESSLRALDGLLNNSDFHDAYYTRAMQQFAEDNVQHLEIRDLLPAIYDNNLNKISTPDVARRIKDLTEDAIQKDPSLPSVQVVYSALRFDDLPTIQANIAEAEAIRADLGNFLCGFDLVGREDTGNPLLYYLDALLNTTIPLVLHAGETDLQYTSIDENLFDAVLLNTTRIGHGFAIARHPSIIQAVMDNGIGIEVCPISNQVLKYVSDLRNHPLAAFLAAGLPVTISPDDPAIWGAAKYGVSYDYYMAFLISGEATGIGVLKQLAINSITYSRMTLDEKEDAMKEWEKRWDVFVKEVAAMQGTF